MKVKLSLVTIAIMAFIFPYFVDAAAETITVDVDGTGYDVIFNTTENLTLNSITADTDAYSLFLEVDSPEGGTLEITFERAFFDSTFEGEDVEFFVLVDGFDELAYDGTSTVTTRTLTMDVPTGTEEIEIIGTKIGSESLDDFVVEEPEPAPPVEEPEPAPPVEEPEPAPPVVEPTPTPPVQEPTPTPPVTEKPKMECGAGTVLKDGVCVLVPKEAAPSTGFMPQGTMNQLVIPAIFAFIVAFFVMVILWIIGRGRRKKKASEQNL